MALNLLLRLLSEIASFETSVLQRALTRRVTRERNASCNICCWCIGTKPHGRVLQREKKAETFAAYRAYTEALKKAGVFLAGSGLQDSSTATVVRAPDGKRTGPERTLYREQGAVGRLLSHRRCGSRWRPRLGGCVVPALSRTRWRFAHSWSIDPAMSQGDDLPAAQAAEAVDEVMASWSPFSRRAHAMSPRQKTPCRRPLLWLSPIGPSTACR